MIWDVKSGRGPGLCYASSQNLGVIFNISVMAEASDFKFGKKLGFAKSSYKITPKDKRGRYRHLWSSQKFGVPFSIFAVIETRNFKLGTQLGFAN